MMFHFVLLCCLLAVVVVVVLLLSSSLFCFTSLCLFVWFGLAGGWGGCCFSRGSGWLASWSLGWFIDCLLLILSCI